MSKKIVKQNIQMKKQGLARTKRCQHLSIRRYLMSNLYNGKKNRIPFSKHLLSMVNFKVE